MEFRLLGPIEVVGDHGPVRLGGEKARAVLAALMLRRARAVSPETLVHAVWERPPPTARHAVAVYVSRLRRAVAAADGGRQRIVTRQSGYALEIDPGELDVEVFRFAAARGREAMATHDWQTAWKTLGDALGTWRATPLACLTSSPLIETRLALEEERLSVVEARLDAGLELGLHLELVPELRQLTREHPERERGWCALMLGLYRSGRQVEALEAFREARTQLRETYGLEPGTTIRELQRRILEQDPTLGLAPLEAETISLPSPPSSFVGRGRDLDEAAAILGEPGVRLLTVLGPGGLGKTRFAIELARRSAGLFPDGVTWVGLDALDDAGRVLDEIAVTLRVEGATGDPLTALANGLRGQRALLVLDCFEHVLGAAPDVHRLLERVPALHVIATSRERLGLSCEHLYWLPPLEPGAAAELFVARARAVSRASLPAPDVVHEVCERLDRLPLGIELVASQLEARTRDQLLATLERSLDVDGRRDPTTRHRTLRTTLDWSYALLDDDERRTLRRLAVFTGGFTPEGAEAVSETSHVIIESLGSKSLVTRTVSRDRYRLLDTVQAYARERLEESREADSAAARHAAWYADLARAREPETYTSGSPDDHRAFVTELPNYRAALAHLVAERNGLTATSMVRSLAPYLYALVATRDGRAMAREVLALPGAAPQDRGRALYFDAALSMDLGLADETRAALAEAEELLTAIDDLRGLSMVENLRCFHEATLGNYAKARFAGDAAGELARKAGSRPLEEIAEAHLAYAYLGLGADGPVRDEEALRRCLALLRPAVDRAEASGSPYELVTAHGNIANPLIELGELELAARHVARAVELQREFPFQLPYVLFTAAVLAGRLGDHATSIRLLVPCLDELGRKGVPLQAYDARRLELLWADARASLGHERLEALKRSAGSVSVDQALELALALEPSPSGSSRCIFVPDVA